MDTSPQAPLILITGGGRGVGAATARLSAAQGYDVAISFVSNEAAALAVAADVEALGRRALTVRADSADPKQVAQLFATIDREFGRIDVLVNNAAIIAQHSRVEDLEYERMRRIFEVNAIGPILCAQQAARRMSYSHNGRGGAIINISSASARLGSPNEYVDYAASKGAVESFTIGFAKEVARDGCDFALKENPTRSNRQDIDETGDIREFEGSDFDANRIIAKFYILAHYQ